MDSKCDNPRCPSTSPSKLSACSGCSAVKYCSKECQLASWPSHRQACKLYPPPSLSGIRVRPVAHHEGNFMKILAIEIEHVHGEKTVHVGSVKIQVIDTESFDEGFFECLDEYSRDLAMLALHFDPMGRLRPNSGCWQPADFLDERFLVYLQEIVIVEAWRGKGLGTWLLPKLFYLDGLNGAQYIFTWPTVLNFLEPIGINGPFGARTLAEQDAWLAKRDRIIGFHRRIGFRRLANGHFFCLAKNSSHPSHSVPIEEDAPFEELPPPETEDEALRRQLANH
ncbi:N-acetyltransferase [Mycena venus]|uniref:N-acetyltransferase n=1 Tax=Mycena venus TaxID=2733690 RepID=A0A8H6YGK1_9AGAR|nr:N-acetyltransferase [Mycena venus]